MSETRRGSSVVARLIGEDYDRHVRRVAPEDFWNQVRPHAVSRPIDEHQIDLTVEAIQDFLALAPSDALLDLACGNAALSDRLAPSCARLHGVDVSEALIRIAAAHFAAPPRITFATADVADYVEQEPDPDRFTKVLCYGSFSYLTRSSAARVLGTLARRFRNVETVFLGNLPDLERVQSFHPGRDPADPDFANPLADFGIWRTPGQLIELARQAGWHATLTTMPPTFHAAHYCYDATLKRRPPTPR